MIERKGRLQRRCDATRDEALSREETRQESSLQPLVLEPTPSNASVAPFGDFQRLSSEPPTPALARILALKRSRPAQSGVGRLLRPRSRARRGLESRSKWTGQSFPSAMRISS